MKRIVISVLFVALSLAHANDITNAYAKEFAFLKAQKTELQNRLQKEKKEQDIQIMKLNQEVGGLQNQYIQATQSTDALQMDVKKTSESLGDATGNKEIVASLAIQAKNTLSDNGAPIKDESISDLAAIELAFNESARLFKELSSIRKTQGEFFLQDGTSVKGEIVHVGNVAAYGISSEGAGALAPAGNGAFKLWNQQGPLSEGKMLADGKMPQELNMFIYETLDKEVDYPKEKTIKETLDMGGPIAYFIVVLGILGLFLLLYKVKVLLNAGSNVEEIKQIIVDKLQNGKGDEALDAINGYHGSVARVMKATLRNIKSDREHIEDIITENIINESTNIDQYGNFILVLAAVAPLVGLLGTVTGMITTFDEIASFGTSDPKLLSGGISEALVNTELGLAVAIPLLLGGNLLSGWAQRIKDTMEQSALHIVNVHKKHKIQ
ncbi:MAG: MotA/TolQ/ExbB proton channel family protein [Sulfuricurvum sp.]|nr:MotA/TolQ/ExbB proton channel family protein [Sulfuricurvum sp.]